MVAFVSIGGPVPLMTDEELAAELCPDAPDVGLRAVQNMTQRQRNGYVRLIDTARALDRHLAGLEPMPAGVIVTRPTKRRTAP